LDSDSELKGVMEQLAQSYDELPFMDRRLSSSELTFHLLPPEMGRLLSQSPDYTSPGPGEGPVWLHVEGPSSSAELIVYRTMSDENLYMVAPVKPE
jgi:hypothetical protein